MPARKFSGDVFILLLPSSHCYTHVTDTRRAHLLRWISCAHIPEHVCWAMESRSSHSRCSRCSTARLRQTTFSASSHLFQVCCLGCTRVALRRQPIAPHMRAHIHHHLHHHPTTTIHVPLGTDKTYTIRCHHARVRVMTVSSPAFEQAGARSRRRHCIDSGSEPFTGPAQSSGSVTQTPHHAVPHMRRRAMEQGTRLMDWRPRAARDCSCL